MNLATAAISLFAFTSVTFAKAWCGNPLPPEGWGCYEKGDCAAHTDWPSESGHFTAPAGAGLVGFKARDLGRGSRIDLSALFKCSSIEDVDRKLACEEEMEVRSSMLAFDLLVPGAWSRTESCTGQYDKLITANSPLQIRVNSTLAKRFRLDYKGPNYLKTPEDSVSCDPQSRSLSAGGRRSGATSWDSGPRLLPLYRRMCPSTQFPFGDVRQRS